MALKVLFDEIVIAKDGVHLSWQVVEVYWLYREMVPRFGGPDFEKGETLTLHDGLRGEIELSSCDAKGITDDHRLRHVPRPVYAAAEVMSRNDDGYVRCHSCGRVMLRASLTKHWKYHCPQQVPAEHIGPKS